MPTLWEHQLRAAEAAASRSYFAFFYETGVGKTPAVIEALRRVYNGAQRIQKTLIFAPVTVCPQWKEEFLRWTKLPESKIHVLTMDGKKRTAILERTEGPIVITNYEAIVSIKGFYAALLKWKPEILVCDESHLLKDPTASRSKNILPLAEGAARRYLLTGTPILNSPMDLFGQYRVMDLGKAFGKNFYYFRKLYCVDKNAGMPKQKYFPRWEVRDAALPTFSKIMAETSMQAKKSECLDLPPLVKIDVPIELSPQQRKLYEQMKRECIVELNGETAVAEFAMTKTLRMQQILCGFVSSGSEDSEAQWVGDNGRLKALSDILESLRGQKIIIWTVFKPTYEAIFNICEKLGRKAVMLTGLQSTKEKYDNVNEFRTGSADTLISNPAAGGTGINLQEAPYSIYFGRTYNLAHYIQSEARNYRGGSDIHERVTHYHLVARGTLDEVVLEALHKKQSVADTIMNWARKEFSKNDY